MKAMRWKLLVVAGVMGAVAVGCASDVEPTPTSDGATTVTSSDSSPTTSTVPMSETTTTTAPSDPTDAVAEAWAEFWSAWADVRASAELSAGPLDGVASPGVVASVLAVLERQRETSGPVDTDVATSPVVMIEAPTAATVEDCVLFEPSLTETAGVWYSAELVDDGSGWRVVSLGIEDSSGCVPVAMADEAIAAYEAYYEAEHQFWNPPDPDHTMLESVLAEPQRSFVVNLLEDHASRGIGLRNQATRHPEVVEVRSPTELVILDCYEPGADDGLYDLASGERLSDEPEVRSGQKNLRSAVMVFDDGSWKVSDFQGQVDFECEFAPTERGLPSV